MKWASILGCAALVGAQCPPAVATPRTYCYAVTHPSFGPIGTYERTIDELGDITRAASRVDITGRIVGFVVHRETADQIELWHGRKLMSFQSVTVVDGRRLLVRGEAVDNRFMVTSPSGTVAVSADVAASDPWSLDRMGSGVVVSIKTGEISLVEVTGGEVDPVMRLGAWEPARHFSVSTQAEPNKWEVWFDRQGVPIKFRADDSNGPVSFTLVSPPQAGDASSRFVLAKDELGSIH